MTVSKLTFNFHGIVGVEVETSDPAARDFYAAEYAEHSAASRPTDIPIVHFKFRRRSLRGGAPAGFIRVSRKLLGRWDYRLDIRPECVTIQVHGNSWAIPLTFHSLVYGSIRWLAARQGVLMLHAGAVTKGELSLLFTGHGGTGKTTTSAVALQHGGPSWLPHADDHMFLDSNGRSYAYITRAHLYRDLLNWAPELRFRLTLLERARLEALSTIRELTKDWLTWPVRVPFSRLFPSKPVRAEAQIAALLLLERAQGNVTSRSLPDIDEVVGELITMNFYEARHFIEYVRLETPTEGFDSWLMNWRRREQEILSRAIRRIPTYRLAIPKLDPREEGQRQVLLDTLESIVLESPLSNHEVVRQVT